MTLEIEHIAFGIILCLLLGALISALYFKLVWTKKLQDLADVKEASFTALDKEYTALKSDADAQQRLMNGQLRDKELAITTLDLALEAVRKESNEKETALATLRAENNALTEKQESQKKELETLNETMQNKFEVIANQILDNKTEKFTKLNETNIKALIEPLGKDIKEFKEKVSEESKERFSLGEKVKDLMKLNDKMSEVAIGLTKALKGENKTQGNWGEMILESLLEKSGLRKDEQYFMEHQLMDAEGKPLRSESEDKKMRPDALIKYPDDRNVIVDSKVSLTAFSRAIDASDDDQYAKELALHLASVKSHIDALSAKGYEDYDKTLDFVLMFVPSEPAYIAAMQADPNLWNYAYEKRILLQSPTNLITSLKLIHELWKREAHNRNAQSIAEQGRKLYDKFVGFIEKLDGVDKALGSAQDKFKAAYDHMSIGPGNLIRQADELKKMVVGTKKELSEGLVGAADLLEERDAEVEQ